MKSLVTLLAFTIVMTFAVSTFAFPVRCYNKDSKVYRAKFVCKGNVKRSVEVRKGTTTLSTQASGPCDFKLNGHTVKLNKGDKLEIKNGKPKKL